MITQCKHCNNVFEQRRSNHLYCKQGCKTMASYERNNYNYISGRYQKEQPTNNLTKGLSIPKNSKLEKKLKTLTKEVKQLSKRKETGLADSFKGTILADALNYGAKKLLAPTLLPATKEDVNELKKIQDVIQKQHFEIQNQYVAILKELKYLKFNV